MIFFYACTSSSFAFLQISLPKESSETLDASTTDFPMSVCNSNLFHVAGLLGCHCGWRCLTNFCEGFRFTFFRFYPWWVVKPPRDFFFLSRVLSYPLFLFLLSGPQVDPFFSPFFISTCRIARGHEEVSTS